MNWRGMQWITSKLIKNSSYVWLQWPGSLCNLQRPCCYPTAGKPASDFSIHGLWPNFNDGTFPQNCDRSDGFNYTEVEDLVPELNKYWGSLSCPSSNSTRFWAHEWDKHGTCSNLTQRDYFSRTLAFLQTLNLQGALQHAGIVPTENSSATTYSVSTVQSVLAAAYTPGVQCNNDKNGRNQLFEVYICVDKDAATPIPCPVYPEGRCRSQIRWPNF